MSGYGFLLFPLAILVLAQRFVVEDIIGLEPLSDHLLIFRILEAPDVDCPVGVKSEQRKAFSLDPLTCGFLQGYLLGLKCQQVWTDGNQQKRHHHFLLLLLVEVQV